MQHKLSCINTTRHAKPSLPASRSLTPRIRLTMVLALERVSFHIYSPTYSNMNYYWHVLAALQWINTVWVMLQNHSRNLKASQAGSFSPDCILKPEP